jgi:hypothetical protein
MGNTLSKLSREEHEYSSQEEYEYDYTHYGLDNETGEIIVAGGGLGNGNAYATVLVSGDNVIYREYGNNPTRRIYRGSTLQYDEEGYRFDIVDA